MKLSRLLTFLAIASAFLAPSLPAADAPKADPRYPFRTDFANAELPWYQPKAGEFPPHHSDRRIGGELVSVDYYLRKGTFRVSKTGELVNFTMGPYAYVTYLNAEADLRDVPLGIQYLFFLNQDPHGQFTILATMQEPYSSDMGHGFTYRLDELKLDEGRLLTSQHKKDGPDLGKRELHVKPETRVWKGEQQVKLADLAAGDELLFNLTGHYGDDPGWCTDVYVGAETHQLTTERQQKRFIESQKKRGLPGWVDKTDGNLLTISLFSGDAANFKKNFLDGWEAGREVSVCVANTELRTWNPPVDKERGSIIEMQRFPQDGYGASGVRLIVKVPYMLEGFRRGHVVRLFGQGWTIKDASYGESLMNYGFARLQDFELLENPAREYPAQFPFQTDYGNEQLPWFQVKAGEAPPPFAEHVVHGDLVKADAAAHTGQFRTERTGETVEFALLPTASVRYLNAESSLADPPLGTRCRFHLFQDEKGAFTKANLVADDYSHSASNGVSWIAKELLLKDGKLHVGKQMALVKDYNGDMQRPPEIGQAEWRITPETRVWKGDQPAKLADLAVGDVLLADFTAEQSGAPAHCTDIWIGEVTHKAVTEQQAKKLAPAKKK